MLSTLGAPPQAGSAFLRKLVANKRQCLWNRQSYRKRPFADDEVDAFLESALSRKYRDHQKTVKFLYERLAERKRFNPWPTNRKKVTCFVMSLISERKAYSTVEEYTGVVRRVSEMSHGPLSRDDAEIVRLALRAAGKTLGKGSVIRAVTLSSKQLTSIALMQADGKREFEGITVAFLLGTFALLRKGEVLGLCKEDVADEGDVFRVTIREDKGDIYRMSAVIAVGCVVELGMCTLRVCPVHRLRQYLQENPVASKPSTSKLFPFSDSIFSKTVKQLVSAVVPQAVDGRTSTHAMRRTGVALLLQAGIPV